jgi:tetratricopeptide (TPR) repeat protein
MRPRGSSGDGEVPETESVKHRNLSELPLEELERLLASPSFTLTFPAAVQVRDRSAALVATDPSLAYRLSSALMDALARSPHGADGRTKAVAWRCRAEACAYTGRSKDAREAYEAACTEAEAAGDRGLLGQILVGRFGLISMMGASAEATRLAKEAERLLREEGDHLYLGKLYMNLGNAFYHQERYAEASKAYGRSAATLERAGQRDATWIGLLINQAVACTQLSQIGEARKLFLKTEASCDELGFGHLKAQAQFNRAFLEQVRGDFREALSLLEESGQTFEQNDEIAMVAASERARAEVYFELGMPREALELARSAAEAFSREEMVIDEMLSHMDEARALLSLDRLSEASETLEKVGSLFEARRNRSSRAIALLLLARVQIELGHLRQARASVLEALRTFDSMGMSQRASEGRRLLATTFLAESKPAKAEDALRPAMDQKRRLPLGERLELWALAGRISMFRNRRPEAASRLRRALRHVDAQRRLIPGVEFRARAFERHVSIYHDLIGLTLSSRRPRFDRLFSLVGAARARGFRERLGARERSVRGDILEKRAQLGSLIRKVEEAEHSDGAEAEKLHDWQAEIRRLERELEREFQKAQAKESGASPWIRSRDAEDVAGQLRRDEALVEYFVTGEAILAFVLTRDRQTFLTLPAAAHSVHECLERIHFQLETMAMTADRPVGSEAFLRGAADELLVSLYSMLVEPLTDRLPPSGRLLLIPHGFLHQVPFECLRDGSQYIDERWEIARIPTADFFPCHRTMCEFSGIRRPNSFFGKCPAKTLSTSRPTASFETTTLSSPDSA